MSMCICLICKDYPVCMAGELKRLQNNNDKLEKENTRLRLALITISNPPSCSLCEFQVKITECMHGKKEWEIASEALV